MIPLTVDRDPLLARVASGYDEVLEAAGRASYCSRPIRLSSPREHLPPSVVSASPSAGDFEDGIVFKACGTRRANLCRACSDRYKGDARVLIRQGLDSALTSTGSKLAAFATFTAPSFGAVHRVARGRQPCHGASGTCIHGRPRGCNARHRESDESLGTPICFECYDYEGAVVFNALSTKLWQRTTIYLRRHLAKLLGVTEKAFNEGLQISYVKVVEFQRRGVIHLHAIVRLDDKEGNPGVAV